MLLFLLQRIGYQLLHALGHAHKKGVVHSDVKPDNILYNTKTGWTKIVDFGLSHWAEMDVGYAGVRS